MADYINHKYCVATAMGEFDVSDTDWSNQVKFIGQARLRLIAGWQWVLHNGAFVGHLLTICRGEVGEALDTRGTGNQILYMLMVNQICLFKSEIYLNQIYFKKPVCQKRNTGGVIL